MIDDFIRGWAIRVTPRVLSGKFVLAAAGGAAPISDPDLSSGESRPARGDWTWSSSWPWPGR